MTVIVKELDGARSVEIEVIDGTVYVDTGRACHYFDLGILVRAFERELQVRALKDGGTLGSVV